MEGLYKPGVIMIDVARTSRETRRSTIFSKAISFLKRFWLPTLLLLPGFILLSVFFIYPTFNMFLSSFMEIDPFKGTTEFVGFSNYNAAFNDSVFIKSLYNTLVYVVFVTGIVIPLSFLISLLVDGCSRRLGSFYRGVLYLPIIMAMSVSAMMWKLILDANLGIISQILLRIGIHMPSLLGDAKYALMTVIGLGIWRSLGANTILFIAGLKSLSREQLDAAKVDGATNWQSTFYIILPNIRYVISFITITTIIGCFQVFSTIQILTSGGPNNATNVLVYKIWQEGFRFFDLGKANAISSLMFVALFGISIVMIRVLIKRTSA